MLGSPDRLRTWYCPSIGQMHRAPSCSREQPTLRSPVLCGERWIRLQLRNLLLAFWGKEVISCQEVIRLLHLYSIELCHGPGQRRVRPRKSLAKLGNNIFLAPACVISVVSDAVQATQLHSAPCRAGISTAFFQLPLTLLTLTAQVPDLIRFIFELRSNGTSTTGWGRINDRDLPVKADPQVHVHESQKGQPL